MTGRFGLYGLCIESELDLPELPRAPTDRATDVSITFGAVDATPAADRSILRFIIPDVARFDVRDGRKIVIELAPSAEPAVVRLYLLGSAMAAILHQRGIVALHANAIGFEGRAFAFMGPSGVGKSTLAAWLAARDCPILSDDVCAIQATDNGGFDVLPGIPRLRLFEDSAAAMGIRSQDLPRVTFPDGWSKVIVKLPAREAPLPLTAIYLLDREADGITQLDPLDAFEALHHNSYRGAMISVIGDAQSHFEQLLTLTRTVPVFRAGRSTLADDGTNTALLEHVRQFITIGDMPH